MPTIKKTVVITTSSGKTEKVTVTEAGHSSKSIEVTSVVDGHTTIVTEKVPDSVHTV